MIYIEKKKEKCEGRDTFSSSIKAIFSSAAGRIVEMSV